ncbi:MAG: glycosyltransferase family 4 protein [Candidatus Latescibacteria bacterium]|nr:glycosyltransferase family 4 protein [Candidatus Latescibacterota bacterium]
MKILTFNYEYPPLGGGGGVVHELLAEELSKRHRVAVITSAYSNLRGREVRGGVEIHRVPVFLRKDQSVATLASMLFYPPAAWIKAAELMSRERFDVINGHFAVPTGPGSLPPAKLGRIPHVLTIQGGDIYDPSKKLSPHRLPGARAAVTFVLRHSDAVIAASTNTRDNAYRYYGYGGPIEIIPLGIRQPVVPQSTREALGLPEGAFLLVTVGRLVKRKAIDDLLRAVARPECSRVELIVVGDGPEREALESIAAALGLSTRVRFLGRVEEIRKWQILENANAYVSSTMHEGFGLVYLEGMAAGLPVVTPDHGGQVDFLRDGETGYVVPAGDLPALARAIARLAERPDEAARMGALNRSRAQEHSIQNCARRYEDVFERVVNRRARARAGVASERP